MSAPDTFSVDVLIAGGGPAGTATALALRRHAPHLSVAVLEASEYAELRVGEVLPAVAAPLLQRLGAWRAFVDTGGARPSPGVAAQWGSGVLAEFHAIFAARHHGWSLDRTRFDSMLADLAHARGAFVHPRTRVASVRRAGDRWEVRAANGERWQSRFVVDATGRSAVVARSLGASVRSYDGLTGFLRYIRTAAASDPRLVIEAVPDGWWYTAPLPAGTRVVAFLTDADIGRQLEFPRLEAWRRQLLSTNVIGRLGDPMAEGALVVRAAGTRRLEPVCANGWLAVGDSAASCDPLSSHGIVKALRDGIVAAYAISDHLDGLDRPSVPGARDALGRYSALRDREFEGYLRGWRRHLMDEQRWPDRTFWRRRHHPDPTPADVQGYAGHRSAVASAYPSADR